MFPFSLVLGWPGVLVGRINPSITASKPATLLVVTIYFLNKEKPSRTEADVFYTSWKGEGGVNPMCKKLCCIFCIILEAFWHHEIFIKRPLSQFDDKIVNWTFLGTILSFFVATDF